MKGITYSLTAIFSSLTLLGILFKVMHWPGASVAFVLGVAGFALIGIPLIAVYKFRQ